MCDVCAFDYLNYTLVQFIGNSFWGILLYALFRQVLAYIRNTVYVMDVGSTAMPDVRQRR